MSLFDDLWQLLRAHGSSAKRETECAESLIATKRGTIYKRTTYPKGISPRRG